METYFVDIKIVGIEEEVTYRPITRLYLVFLKLSHTPHSAWIRFFNESRKTPRHPLWRNATIDRRFIALECVPEEIETHLLEGLKQDVSFANARYREFLKKELQEEMAIRGKAPSADRITELRNRLKFD